jgi:hypothetical protein
LNGSTFDSDEDQGLPAKYRYSSCPSAGPVSFGTAKGKVVLSVIVGLLVLALLVFVWPTPYLIVRDSKGHIYRVNRFTGVREEATEKGWRTKDQLDADRWTQHAQAQAANEQREAEEESARQKQLDQVLQDLKRIKISGTRNQLDRLIISNPTSWDLEGAPHNTTLEYFARQGRSEEFLAKQQSTNSYLKAFSVNDLRLRSELPPEVTALPAGSVFFEKIFIQFDRAINRETGKRIELKPAFVWKHQRSWNVPDLSDYIDR